MSALIKRFLEYFELDLEESADPFSQYLHQEKIRETIEGSAYAPPINVVLALICVYVLWGHCPSASILIWFGYLLLVNIGRWVQISRYRSTEIKPSSILAARRFSVGVVLSALGWGALMIVLFPHDDPPRQLFQALTIAGLTSAGVIVLSNIRGAVLPFVFIVLTPVIVRFTLEVNPIHYGLALMVAVFLLFILRTSSLIEKNFSRLVALNFEKKKLAENLEEALAQARAASRMKTNFLANVSHEIRTPLNGIIGMTEHAVDSNPDADMREYLEIILESAQWLLLIIDDLLDLSKIELGKLEISPRPFELRKELIKIEQFLQPRISEKQLQFASRIDTEVPNIIEADPLRISQVLMNLIGNAIKFTPENGSINLEVSVQKAEAEDLLLRIAVADTGIGISAEAQKNIFQAFSQGDSSTTRKYGGTGLGLAISSQLIDLMGGEISLESELGKGTCFALTVPCCKGQLEDLSADDSLAGSLTVAGSQSMNILLAEDNRINQRIIVYLLEKQGHNVVVVANGVEAVAAAAERDFDAILMDCQMPVMDGYTATREIRRHEQETGRRVPIIALTAHAMKGDKDRCIAAGMDDYLAKPVHRTELLSALCRLKG
jgi:two-component system, sensor histidine kinase